MSARILRWALIVATIVVLQLLTRAGVIDKLIMTPPTEILSALWSQVRSSAFWSDLRTTGETVLLAAVFGTVAGVALGTLCWRVAVLGDVLEPYLGALYAMPVLVFYPILLAMMGLGIWPIVTIAALMVLVPVALNTVVGLRSVDPVLPKMGRAMNCGSATLVYRIMMPAATPMIVSGIRLGCIYGIIGTLAMEFILSDSGLGFRIGESYKNFDISQMWSSIVLVTILTVAASSLLTLAERRVRGDAA